MVHVSTASALFLEKGLNPQGIFTLLLNAVERENMKISYMNMWLADTDSLQHHAFLSSMVSSYKSALKKITDAEAFFRADLESARDRILKFISDHEQIKTIDEKLQKISFWQMLFSKRQEYHALNDEKLKIKSMTIHISELINIAFFRYNQVTGYDSQDFIKELNAFLKEKHLEYQNMNNL